MMAAALTGHGLAAMSQVFHRKAFGITITVMFVPKYAYQVFGDRRKLLETNKFSINKSPEINSVFPPLFSLFEEFNNLTVVGIIDSN
jgi:hypothetical protein